MEMLQGGDGVDRQGIITVKNEQLQRNNIKEQIDCESRLSGIAKR